eukprot:COSAG02_NODE_1055_length_14928_cov_67.022726_11_plen_199_part_00
MGWNSWESYETDTSAELFIETASAMVKLGLPALGYTHFNTDAGWELLTFPNGTKRPCAARGSDGMLLADPAKFPGGLRPVAEHVNKLGLQWGMYLPFHACPATGSTKFDHPAADIQLCTELNATYVKVDALQFSSSPMDTQAQMIAFRKAINESTMPQMFFSNVRSWSLILATQRTMARSMQPCPVHIPTAALSSRLW